VGTFGNHIDTIYGMQLDLFLWRFAKVLNDLIVLQTAIAIIKGRSPIGLLKPAQSEIASACSVQHQIELAPPADRVGRIHLLSLP